MELGIIVLILFIILLSVITYSLVKSASDADDRAKKIFNNEKNNNTYNN